MKNKPNFFLITGVSQTGGVGGGGPPLGNFSHIIPFFSDNVHKIRRHTALDPLSLRINSHTSNRTVTIQVLIQGCCYY